MTGFCKKHNNDLKWVKVANKRTLLISWILPRICSKLMIKTPAQRCYGVFIVNLERIQLPKSGIFIVEFEQFSISCHLLSASCTSSRQIWQNLNKNQAFLTYLMFQISLERRLLTYYFKRSNHLFKCIWLFKSIAILNYFNIISRIA